jgi:hypothetical protein
MKGPIHSRLFVFTWLLLGGYTAAFGQVATNSRGSVEVIADSRLDLLVEKHIRINETLKTTEGFRIHLFSDSGNNSKSRAQEMQDELIAGFPGTGVYLTFKSPNYRVRLGNFRTRLDAQRFLNDIAIDYPNAFIVNDMINLIEKQTLNP